MKLPNIGLLPLCALIMAMLCLISFADPVLGGEINWDDIRQSRITLFYPGRASMEFLVSDDHRLGARNIKKGKKNCRRCHLSKKGVLDLKADEIASGTAKMKRSRLLFEDKPIANKKGVLLATIKAAYDRDYIYLLLSWPSKGEAWSDRTKNDSIHPDRVSIQLNKKENFFSRYGCFISCHNDLTTMPRAPSSKEVLANPFYSRQKRDDVRLYAYYTRNGAWNKMKTTTELHGLLEAGGLMDLWSMKLKAQTSTTMDGWVFDDRRWEKKSDITGDATWSKTNGGRYTVYFKRRLLTKDKTDIQLKDGDKITIAVAIHDDNTKKRQHYVSFPMTLGFGLDADIVAGQVR